MGEMENTGGGRGTPEAFIDCPENSVCNHIHRIYNPVGLFLSDLWYGCQKKDYIKNQLRFSCRPAGRAAGRNLSAQAASADQTVDPCT